MSASEEYVSALTELYNEVKEYDPWLVGSGAQFFVNYLVYGEDSPVPPPKDIDIIIPDTSANREAVREIVPDEHEYTSMGGYRFQINGIIVDMWFDDVAIYVIEVPTSVESLAINLRTGGKICSFEYLASSSIADKYEKTLRECNYLIETRPTRKANPERFDKYLYDKGLKLENNQLQQVQGTV